MAAPLWALRGAHTRASLYSGAPNETLLLYSVAEVLVVLGYQLAFLALLQRTLAMLITATVLVDQAAGRVTAGQAAARLVVSWDGV
mgnify:CR=1 FL=1